MRTIRHVLDEKGYTIAALSPDETVLAAITMMADQGIGSLLVMAGEGLADIVTERDYAQKVALMDRKSPETRVGAVMSPAEIVALDATIPSCMDLMTKACARQLVVVVDNNQVEINQHTRHSEFMTFGFSFYPCRADRTEAKTSSRSR